jgi:antitoxin (DNA-binding transcriptional repressor) of toxin-antitoxin stability system
MDKEFPVEHDREVERLVEQAERGESVVLTRKGRPVAKIVADVATDDDRTEAIAAMERILAIGTGVSLGGLRFKDLIEAGRKY